MNVRFSISKKILSAILVVAFAFAGLSGYTFFQLNEIEKGYDGLLTRSAPLVFEVQELTLELRTQGYYARGYLLTGDKAYITQYQGSRQKMDKLLTSLEKKLTTPEGKQKLTDLKEALTKYHGALEKTLQIRDEKGTAESLAYMSTAGAISRDTEQKMNDFVSFLTERMNLRIKENHQAQRQIEMLILILDAVIIIMAVIIALWLSRKIASALKVILDAANKIAAGDLSQTSLNYRENDEIGDMIKAFGNMRDNLRELVKQTTDASVQVATSSGNLTQGAEQSAQAAVQVAQAISLVSMGSDSQVVAVDEASKVVEDMSANITQVAANSDLVVSASRKAADSARNGEEVINKAVEQMVNAQRTVSDSAGVIAELGDKSKEIGQIVATISGIATQTNLLALNAAIEAARAGEQGRGFAVVADEVKKLAEQSQDAAKQISDMIAGIQGDTGKAVEVMNTGKLEVEAGAHLVKDAGTAFAEIRDSIETVSVQVDGISASIEQLAAGSKQILASVHHVEEISKQTAAEAQSVSAATEEQSASMQEISASSQALNHMADQLKAAVTRFKL